jgi:hypothetical protein
MAETKQPVNPFVDAELMEGMAKFQPLSPKQFQFYIISALTRLNTQMKDLVGNGSPGRITRLAERVHQVELHCAAQSKCSARRRPSGKKRN